VGYGDIYPVTVMGQIFGAVVSVGGLLLVALPTGILGAGFVEEFEKYARQQELDLSQDAALQTVEVRVAGACPHCGQSMAGSEG
jgi:voltage-gated potassium channel